MMVHSALTRSIPTCLAVIGAACLLAGCAPAEESDYSKTLEANGKMVQVRSCASGVYVYRDPQGDLWSGYPNQMRIRSRISEELTPEEYCR